MENGEKPVHKKTFQEFINVQIKDLFHILITLLRKKGSWTQTLLIIAIIGFILEFTGIWWLSFVSGFIGGILLKKENAFFSFTAGFFGLLLAWGTHMAIITFYNSIDNLNQLSMMFGWNAGSIILITLSIGAVFGGLGAINGDIFSRILKELRIRREQPKVSEPA